MSYVLEHVVDLLPKLDSMQLTKNGKFQRVVNLLPKLGTTLLTKNGKFQHVVNLLPNLDSMQLAKNGKFQHMVNLLPQMVAQIGNFIFAKFGSYREYYQLWPLLAKSRRIKCCHKWQPNIPDIDG